MRLFTSLLGFALLVAVVPTTSAQTSARTDSAFRPSSSAGSRTFAGTNKGFTGISYGATVTTGPDGSPRWATYPVIRLVVADSPAAKAGLVVGDSIISVNGADARVNKILEAKEGGEKFSIRVRRGSEYLDFAIVSARKPAPTP